MHLPRIDIEPASDSSLPNTRVHQYEAGDLKGLWPLHPNIMGQIPVQNFDTFAFPESLIHGMKAAEFSQGCIYSLKSNDPEPVGICGLRMEDQSSEAEITVHRLAAHSLANKLITPTVLALSTYALKNYDADSVSVDVIESDVASVNSCREAGFVHFPEEDDFELTKLGNGSMSHWQKWRLCRPVAFNGYSEERQAQVVAGWACFRNLTDEFTIMVQANV